MYNTLSLNMKEALKIYYMDYAMSVIVDRALPDVRDGLKPVHRRILYSMEGLKLYYSGRYMKSARTVGECLGKYHPHGDTSVYDALVRMAQDFSLRYPLIDGHGNFGDLDGSPAAAMRYTESKMSELTTQMLRDINMNTVDMIPNFDGEELEPSLLPSRFPNLLVNGSSGVSVGFATNIPPHNLTDAINQVIYQIDNPNCTVDALVNILKAPDFPTGGTIINPENMLSIYKEGKGSIIVRGKYHIEDEKTIVFTEIPYQVNKLTLLDNITMLKNGYWKKVKDGKSKKVKDVFVPPLIPQIVDLHDDSNGRQGIKINIEVDLVENIDLVLRLLFDNTRLQDSFGANFTAVKGNTLLEKMSLKEINDYYIEFQKDVIRRRTQFQLDKALKELNRLEGIIKVLGDIDKTIDIIKKAKNNEIARIGLMGHFKLNEIQAGLILEMKLKRLTCLEVDTMKKKYEEITKYVKELNKILGSEDELLAIIKMELIEISDKYGDDRKTDILYEDNLAYIDTKEVEIEDYNCRVLLTDFFIKKHLKQSSNHKLKDGEDILCDISSTNKSTILAFTNKGNRFRIDCNSLITKTPSEWGEPLNRVFNLEKDEKVIKVVSVEEEVGSMIFMFKNGKLAKTNISKYLSRKKVLKNCFNLESELMDMEYIKDDVDVLSITQKGKGLIYNTREINSTNGASKGNKGIDGEVIAVAIDVKATMTIKITTEKGKVKEILLGDNKDKERTWFDYINGKRGNKGTFVFNPKNDNIISCEIIK